MDIRCSSARKSGRPRSARVTLRNTSVARSDPWCGVASLHEVKFKYRLLDATGQPQQARSISVTKGTYLTRKAAWRLRAP